MKTYVFFTSLFLILILSSNALAKKGIRASNWFGISFGFFSDPHPAFVGASLKFNTSDWFRFGFGIGTGNGNLPKEGREKVTATNVMFQILPIRWNLSPYIGASGSYMIRQGDVNKKAFASVHAGLDLTFQAYRWFLVWRLKNPFKTNIGVGYTHSPMINHPYQDAVHVYLGAYF